MTTNLSDLNLAHDGYGNRVKPSDTVRWDFDRECRRVSLHGLGRVWRLFDKTEGERRIVRDDQWTAVITYAGLLANQPGLSMDDRVWTLTTQGAEKGGRRYRIHLTFAEAQKAALAWLDRRYAVVEVDA